MMILGIVLCMSVGVCAEQMTITHAQRQMIGMRVAYLGAAAERVASVIASDMACSGQYAVEIKEYCAVPKKQSEITNLVQENILFLLILESHTRALEYRLYDTTTGTLVPKANGKCTVLDDADARYGHHIADQLWQQLMGVPSIFNTKLAYAKEIPYKGGIAVKHICTADYNGGHEQTMVATPTISIAPRWGGTQEAPLIFYSEYTKTNVRLMAVDQRKKRAVVTRYDGVSMHLTPNVDRSMHAYSASRGDGNSHIYLIHGKTLEQCTFGDVTDACPTFNHDGSVMYYCSDADTGSPHIMAYTLATKRHTALPIKGSCFSPAYNPARNLLAYSKAVDGYLQIFVWDFAMQQEKQLTHDIGHHEAPTWSPDGAFLAYTHQVGSTSRIRMHCYATGHEQYVTPAQVNCSYPAWSLW